MLLHVDSYGTPTSAVCIETLLDVIIYQHLLIRNIEEICKKQMVVEVCCIHNVVGKGTRST